MSAESNEWGPLMPTRPDGKPWAPGVPNRTWGDLDCGETDEHGRRCLHRYRHRGRCLFPVTDG